MAHEAGYQSSLHDSADQRAFWVALPNCASWLVSVSLDVLTAYISCCLCVWVWGFWIWSISETSWTFLLQRKVLQGNFPSWASYPWGSFNMKDQSFSINLSFVHTSTSSLAWSCGSEPKVILCLTLRYKYVCCHLLQRCLEKPTKVVRGQKTHFWKDPN